MTRISSRIARCVVIVLTTAVAVGANAPVGAALPKPPWKAIEEALGAIKGVWKESPEARFAAKLLRKTTAQGLKDWRRSKGGVCPWRSVWPTYCRNGFAVAAVPIDFFIRRTWIGHVNTGTVLSAACITRGDPAFVRTLWPVPTVPSVFVRKDYLQWSLQLVLLPRC
jgi:hypothetical protein